MSYGQFCPISKAAEIVAEKWSLIIIRELLAGSRTFNALRSGMPLISPSLLSRRLLELEEAGIVEKQETGEARPKYNYHPTEAAEELGPVLMQLGDWGNRWIGADLEKEDYDPGLLMWDVRRAIDPGPIQESLDSSQHYVVRFDYSGAVRGQSRWWLVIDPDEVDLCYKNPGHEVRLVVSAHIKTLTEIWMGWQSLARAKREGSIQFEGMTQEIRMFPKWFTLNVFAHR